MIILAATTNSPASGSGTDPASRDHLTLLQGIATEAKLLLGRKG